MERKSTDWSAIKASFMAGTRSIRAIARRHGLSESAVRKRAKRDGWQRPGRVKFAPRKHQSAAALHCPQCGQAMLISIDVAAIGGSTV